MDVSTANHVDDWGQDADGCNQKENETVPGLSDLAGLLQQRLQDGEIVGDTSRPFRLNSTARDGVEADLMWGLTRFYYSGTYPLPSGHGHSSGRFDTKVMFAYSISASESQKHPARLQHR